MAHRTFKLTSPHMKGEDIRAFQHDLNRQLNKWDIKAPLTEDGDYGQMTRSVIASVCHASGFNAGELMEKGITPWLRTKIRNQRRNAYEAIRFAGRVGYRRRLRARYASSNIAPITAKVIEDSWGYHPPGHDGLDIITPERAPIFAMCDGTITRVSSGGWWGKAPSGDTAKGDGIIILNCEVDSGPFFKGANICYGHAEEAVVRVGQKVKAGQQIGRAGLAVAWHIHLMVNNRSDEKGLGDRDPRPFYNHAQRSR